MTRRPASALLTALLSAALLLASVSVPLAEAQSSPATPGSVTVTRADGTVTASWPAADGATKYHVTYSSDSRRSWTAASRSYAGTSITIGGVDNAKSYIVAVRAGNAAGWSGWRNSSPAGPYTPPPSTPPPSTTPPTTPSSVTVTRADGTVTASGYAVSNAAKYHITYSSNGGYSWTAASISHTGTSITIGGVDNAKSYIVAVRAGNAAGWSGWRNSSPAGPYTLPPAAPSSVTVTRGDGTVTASWPAVSGADMYRVIYSSDDQNTWTTASDNHTGTAITIDDADNTKTYYVAVRAGNSVGWSGWTTSPASPATTIAGIILQDTSGNAITTLSIPEGGEASYQVKLASQPAQDVEVCIGLSVRDRNDSSITFKGQDSSVVAIKVPFTPDNWNTAQTVTLEAAEDEDDQNGVRTVIHDTRDLGYYVPGDVRVAATEIDND